MEMYVRKIKRIQEITQYYIVFSEAKLGYIDRDNTTPAKQIFGKPTEETIEPWQKVPEREAALVRGSSDQVIPPPRPLGADDDEVPF